MLRISNMPFSEIYRRSQIWVNKLLDLSVKNINLASDLAGLGLTAQNEIYISTWWRVLEEYNGVKIYRTERPKSREDMIKIFDYISINYNENEFNYENALECYNACLVIQDIRRKFLHNEFPALQNSMGELVDSVVCEGNNFEISYAKFDIIGSDKLAMCVYKADGEIK